LLIGRDNFGNSGVVGRILLKLLYIYMVREYETDSAGSGPGVNMAINLFDSIRG
jgi:hypothetical protein